MIVRVLALLLALLALGAGGYGLALDQAPKQPLVKSLGRQVAAAARAAGTDARSVEAAVRAPVGYGLLAFGVVALGVALRPRRKREDEEGRGARPVRSQAPQKGLDARIARKARRQAAAMARKGDAEIGRAHV